MFCPKCGGELKENARFCNHCGAAVGSGPAAGQQGGIRPTGRGAGSSGNPVQRGAGPAGAPPGGYRPAGSGATGPAGSYPPAGAMPMGTAPGQPPKKKKGKGWLAALIVILIILLLGGGGFLAYRMGLFDTVLSSVESNKGLSDKDEKENSEDRDEGEEESGDEDSGEEDPEEEDLDEEDPEAFAENDGTGGAASYGDELPDLIREGEGAPQSSYSDPTAARETTLATEAATMPVTMPATAPATMPETISGAGGAYGQTMAEQDYILPESSTRSLTSADLAGLTKDQLRIARNEIYARHGRRFDSEDLANYFNSKSWYRGTIAPSDFRDNMLSQVEKDNLQVIKKAEENLQ